MDSVADEFNLGDKLYSYPAAARDVFKTKFSNIFKFVKPFYFDPSLVATYKAKFCRGISGQFWKPQAYIDKLIIESIEFINASSIVPSHVKIKGRAVLHPIGKLIMDRVGALEGGSKFIILTMRELRGNELEGMIEKKTLMRKQYSDLIRWCKNNSVYSNQILDLMKQLDEIIPYFEKDSAVDHVQKYGSGRKTNFVAHFAWKNLVEDSDLVRKRVKDIIDCDVAFLKMFRRFLEERALKEAEDGRLMLWKMRWEQSGMRGRPSKPDKRVWTLEKDLNKNYVVKFEDTISSSRIITAMPIIKNVWMAVPEEKKPKILKEYIEGSYKPSWKVYDTVTLKGDIWQVIRKLKQSNNWELMEPLDASRHDCQFAEYLGGSANSDKGISVYGSGGFDTTPDGLKATTTISRYNEDKGRWNFNFQLSSGDDNMVSSDSKIYEYPGLWGADAGDKLTQKFLGNNTYEEYVDRFKLCRDGIGKGFNLYDPKFDILHKSASLEGSRVMNIRIAILLAYGFTPYSYWDILSNEDIIHSGIDMIEAILPRLEVYPKLVDFYKSTEKQYWNNEVLM